MKTMTGSEFDRKIEELILSIKATALPFEESDPISIAQRSNKALNDYEFFAKTYFPHYVTSDFGAFQREMLDLCSRQNTITAIAAARGHGKTVNLGIIRPIWLILRGEVHFLVSVSDNEDLAAERTAAIATEFQVNERLLMDFGDSVNPVYDAKDYIVRQFCRVLARGYGQPIRGILFGHYRPDYIIVDDFESHNAKNPKIAKEKNEYVRGEAFGALPNDGRGVVIWLGNLTHAESALNLFKKDCEQEPDNPHITFKCYPAIKEDGSLQWPELYTHEKLESIKQAMGSISFQRHYMMNPIQEGIKFLTTWFRFESVFPERFDAIVSYCDPSMSSKATADYKSIITLGLANKRYYLLDCWIRRTSINAMIEKLYSLDAEFKGRIFMESVLWQKVLWEFIPPFSESKGYLLPVAGIENRLPKDQRIEAITPLFEWGWIIFPKDKTADTILLEEQLLGFPSHPNDDGPDALAGSIDCLKAYGRPMEYKSLKTGSGSRFSGL